MIAYIGCQTCDDWKGWPLGAQSLFVEPKMDGYRLNAIVGPDGAVHFYCRDEASPEWAENLDHLIPELQRLGKTVAGGVMFDGEVMAKDWNRTSTLLRRKRSLMTDEIKAAVAAEIKFHIFDRVRLHDVTETVPAGRRKVVKLSRETMQERRDRLTAGFVGKNFETLVLVPGWHVSSERKADELFEELLDLGFEGAIVKKLDAPYIFDRNPGWLKRKPVKTFDVTITGAVEGKGKHVGRLGAFLCVTADGKEVSVGGGMTDVQRAAWWLGRTALIGCSIEIKSQDDKVAKAARHPVFLRFREEKLGQV